MKIKLLTKKKKKKKKFHDLSMTLGNISNSLFHDFSRPGIVISEFHDFSRFP